MAERLIRKLEQRDALSEEEKAALRQLPVTTRSYAAGEDIVRIRDAPRNSNLLLDGLVCRYRDDAAGRRQILAIHVPGDFVDLQSFLLKVMDHNVMALGPARLAIVPHEELRRLTERFPHLSRMLWLSTLIDAAIHREWLLAMGIKEALARAAHLICELHLRLKLVGLAKDDSFDLPVTQRIFGDALGLSAVHANRVIQALRAKGMVSWEGDRLVVRDLAGLSDLAEFDPVYLHLEKTPR